MNPLCVPGIGIGVVAFVKFQIKTQWHSYGHDAMRYLLLDDAGTIGIDTVMPGRFGHDFVIQCTLQYDDFRLGARLGVVAVGQGFGEVSIGKVAGAFIGDKVRRYGFHRRLTILGPIMSVAGW